MSLKTALSGPFAGMAMYKQFILWRTEKRGANLVKLPIGTAGHLVSVTDPNAWVTADEAVAALESGTGHGIGFVFTESDPFIFLDIDKCLDDAGQWSAIAQEMVNALPGAAVEVSQSGRGLHIFGRCAEIPHSCKNAAYGLELYHKERFVALTGASASGDCTLDITGPISAIIPPYFPFNAGAGAALENWTTAPRAEWCGPEDDDELIAIACRSNSAAGAFGKDKATFEQLWEMDVAAISGAYPDNYSGREWDMSGVDSALAFHLAFWTGSNCERIARIMLKSQHVRDKWDREAYFKGTIAKAAGMQGKYYANQRYSSTPAAVAPTSPAAVVADVSAGEATGSPAFMSIPDQVEHFRGCTYVRDAHRIATPCGAMLEMGQFRAMYGGHAFAVDASNTKTIKNAWEAFTESQGTEFPKVEKSCFRPELPNGEIITEDGVREVNTYVPINIPSEPGDVAPFLAHLAKSLPVKQDSDILVAYMAGVVQNKGKKSQWSPLLQGVEGNGKTLFTRCVARAVGRRYFHTPKAEDLGNKFNAWLSGKILIGVEDIYVSEKRQDIIETLKPMITAYDGLEIQAKGGNQVTMDICANFMFNSNHKDAIRKHKNDRRFAILYTAQQEVEDLARDGMVGDYFPNLYTWLESGGYSYVTNYLENYAIPDELDFTKKCHRAPVTSSTAEAITASVGSVEQEVIEAIDEGRTGFRGGWVSSIHLSRLLEEKRLASRMPNKKRREMMIGLGYECHPALPNGRSNSAIATDGGKPRLYILEGQGRADMPAPDVSRLYESAQVAPEFA